MRYNPALDGLRAVAILLVILTHSFHYVFPAGWIGVDVFFVLSGFLITTILRREHRETGAISMLSFYRRRALRLGPAFVVLIAFQLTHAVFSPHNSVEILEATAISAAYMENLNSVFHFGPWDLVGHTWSLATEEQFYLLWPFALPLVLTRRPLIWMLSATAAMVAWSSWLLTHGAALTHIEYGPDARPVGLLLGCALAFLPARLWPCIPAATPFALVAGFLVIGAVGTEQLSWFIVIAPVTTSLATVVLIMAAQSGGRFAAALSWAPLIYVGKVSYGLYLYSLPICAFGAAQHVNPFALIAASFAAAALSYEFIEKPFLRLKDRRGARSAAEPMQPAAVAAE
jgi:peptidoglycan/LPS O-acetylase OafA/YrhL